MHKKNLTWVLTLYYVTHLSYPHCCTHWDSLGEFTKVVQTPRPILTFAPGLNKFPQIHRVYKKFCDNWKIPVFVDIKWYVRDTTKTNWGEEIDWKPSVTWIVAGKDSFKILRQKPKKQEQNIVKTKSKEGQIAPLISNNILGEYVVVVFTL